MVAVFSTKQPIIFYTERFEPDLEHYQAIASFLGIYKQIDVSFTVWDFVRVVHECKGEGTPRKLATATQPQFPRIVISLS
jgi:hypothetical protein